MYILWNSWRRRAHKNFKKREKEERHQSSTTLPSQIPERLDLDRSLQNRSEEQNFKWHAANQKLRRPYALLSLLPYYSLDSPPHKHLAIEGAVISDRLDDFLHVPSTDGSELRPEFTWCNRKPPPSCILVSGWFMFPLQPVGLSVLSGGHRCTESRRVQWPRYQHLTLRTLHYPLHSHVLAPRTAWSHFV